MRWLIDIWDEFTLTMRLATVFFIFFALVALLAHQLTANDAFIAYGPNSLSSSSASFKPPGFVEGDSAVHWMGTDRIGRDVAARMIVGARTAFLVGFGSSLLSFIIALILGTCAGYYANDRIQINWVQLIWILLTGVLIYFYSYEFFQGLNAIIIFVVGILLSVLVSRFLKPLVSVSLAVPIDTIVMKIIEVINTIPGLFLVLSLFVLIDRPGLMNVILIIGLISWPGKTRILRAEILKVKEENYIKSARLLGLSDWRLIVYHILPNTLSPLLVALAFSFTSAILLESTLSFLNVGLPQEIPSWGSIMRDARDYFPAWWLAFFPGLAIFMSVLTLNVFADYINHQKR
jgi:peptide/nickel transport system permease protein